jgi:predicted DNA-binding transcriptional regulator AlpA
MTQHALTLEALPSAVYTLNQQVAEIKSMISSLAKEKLDETSTEPERFVDQKKVSEIYGISSVTVWDWERKSILKSYRIGNLKRFKLSEVMQAPVPIKRIASQK